MNDTLEIEAEPVNTQAVVRRQAMEVTTPMSVQEIVGQVRLIQEIMRSVMKEDEHYGTIPGCGDKKVLLKSGAEKLGMTFRLAPTFTIKRTDLPNAHREYEVVCTLNDKYQGVGTCSTMEGKYRYRTGPKKPTGKAVPKEYWDLRGSNPAKAQELLGGKGFSTMKEDGRWVICEQGEKVEHDNPADHFNTVLKMAKKRAHVDAILTATAASDIFTQDEDVITGANQTPVDEPEQAGGSQDTTKAKKTPPGATAVSTTASIKPFKSRDVLVKLLDRHRGCAVRVLQSRGVLTPAETLEQWPEDKLPKNANELNDLLAAVQKEADGDQVPGAEAPTPALELEPEVEKQWWMDVEIPFGKQKGKKLSELGEKSLAWWCENYQPKPYNGQISDKDRQFREALDAAAEYHMENA